MGFFAHREGLTIVDDSDIRYCTPRGHLLARSWPDQISWKVGITSIATDAKDICCLRSSQVAFEIVFGHVLKFRSLGDDIPSMQVCCKVSLN